jgi:diguanylate cyclase (GGDEF)-like protein/PAS domain S-box-containing protein
MPEQHGHLVDRVSIFSAKVALDGRILEASASMALTTGLAHDELTQMNFVEGPWWAFDHEVQARVRDAFQHAATGEVLSYEENFLSAGLVLPITLSLVPVHAKRHVSHVLAEGRAIATKKDGHPMFQELFEAAPDAIVAVDRRGLIRFVNRQAEARFGYQREEMIGKPLEMLVPERFRDIHRVHRDSYVADPRTRPMGAGLTLTGRRRDGTEFPVDISLSASESEEGLLVTAAVRDISERQLAAIVESFEDAMIREELNGTILTWNSAAERIFGYAGEEVLGRSVTILSPADRQDEIPMILDRIARGERVDALETIWMRKDGTPVQVSLIVSPVKDEKGRVAGASTSARDITEHKRIESALRESEERFRRVFEDGQVGMALVGHDLRFVEVNESLARLHGYTCDELVTHHISEITHPDDVGLDLGLSTKLFAGEIPSYQIEKRHIAKSGETRWVNLIASALRPGPGGPSHAIWMIEDIGFRKTAERALREAKELFASAFDHAPIGIALMSLEGRLLEVNRALCRMTGYAPEELLGTDMRSLAHPDDIEAQQAYLEQALSGQIISYQVEQRYRHADGRLIWVLVSVSLVKDSEDEPLHFILQAEDVTERRLAEDQLVHRSLHDPLTALPNRMLFLDRLKQSLGRESRSPGSVAVMFLDLDHFKVINDSLGHEAGDEVLRAMAARLQASVRPGDTVSRFGGDEFVILCEDILDERQVTVIADRLAATVSAPIALASGDVVLTTSAGVAIAATSTEKPEDLIRDADAALYRAKDRGRARHEIFDPAMRVRAVKRMQIERELRQAIDHGDLRLHYQPIVRLADGRITGVEALVRWQHPQRGLVPPNEFISVAEETGLIEPMGSWVLREACGHLRSWPSVGPGGSPLVLAVNVSARELARYGFADRIAATLEEAGVPPRTVCLEITETVLIEAARSALSSLDELRKLGVVFAIDDFGTGYSSLTYLKRFEVDSLKLDRSFVHGLGEDPEDSAIVSAVVALAHALDLTIVAEGVESEGQRTQLQDLGCDQAQGYYFARPQPAVALAKLLASGFATT